MRYEFQLLQVFPVQESTNHLTDTSRVLGQYVIWEVVGEEEKIAWRDGPVGKSLRRPSLYVSY